MMSERNASYSSTLEEESVAGLIEDIPIDENIKRSVDFKVNNKETLIYRYHIKLKVMSREVNEGKMIKKSLENLQITHQCILDWVQHLERDFATITGYQSLSNLALELIGWFKYLQKKLEVHIEERTMANLKEDSCNSTIIDISENVLNHCYLDPNRINIPNSHIRDSKVDSVKSEFAEVLASSTEEFISVLTADVSVNVEDLIDNEACEVNVSKADTSKDCDYSAVGVVESVTKEVFLIGQAESETKDCKHVVNYSATYSELCIQLIFDDKFRLELVQMFFSVLNFKLIELTVIIANPLIFKCQRSLDGSILLPEFAGIIDSIMYFLILGHNQNLKFYHGMNFCLAVECCIIL